MSAPLVWIFLPLIAGLGLWWMQKRPGLLIMFACGLCLLLAGMAAVLPIGSPIQLGSLSLVLRSDQVVLGRLLVLDAQDRPFLVFFYSVAAFWMAGVNAAGGHRTMGPFSLGILALLVAALAVQPGLYAALLVEGAVLLSVPLLVPPGGVPSQGVVRYLVFITLGMPFYILGSWALAGAGANPTNTNLVLLTSVFLGLGFAFWLAFFPFFTWAPLLSGQTRPYASGFIFMFLPTVGLLLGVSILGGNGWLRDAPLLQDVFRIGGGVMIITAGFWAAFERDLGRLFGYIAVAQTGFSILALSLGNLLGHEIFIMNFLPRIIALGLWSLSASVLRANNRSMAFNDLLRAAERTPLAAFGLAVAFLSMAGLPLLAEFPIRVVLLQEIAVAHPVAALFILLGSVGLLFSAFRFLAVITGGRLGLERRRGTTGIGETRAQRVLITVAILALLVVGVFPRVFFPVMVGILPAFGLLQ